VFCRRSTGEFWLLVCHFVQCRREVQTELFVFSFVQSQWGGLYVCARTPTYRVVRSYLVFNFVERTAIFYKRLDRICSFVQGQWGGLYFCARTPTYQVMRSDLVCRFLSRLKYFTNGWQVLLFCARLVWRSVLFCTNPNALCGSQWFCLQFCWADWNILQTVWQVRGNLLDWASRLVYTWKGAPHSAQKGIVHEIYLRDYWRNSHCLVLTHPLSVRFGWCAMIWSAILLSKLEYFTTDLSGAR
jgi:hypothetical protein